MALPKLVAPAKRLLEFGIRYDDNPERAYTTYESNVEFEVRIVFSDVNHVAHRFLINI